MDPPASSNGHRPPPPSKAPQSKAPQSQAPPPSRELTGEITVQNRSITSRWRPGEPLKSKPARKRRDRRSKKADRQPGPGSPAGPLPSGSASSRAAHPAGSGSPGGSVHPAGSGFSAGSVFSPGQGSSPGPGSQLGQAASAAGSAAGGLRSVLPGAVTRAAQTGSSALRRVLPGLAARGIARKAAAAWRVQPLEATAITLMVIVGLAYPFPVWWVCFLVWLVAAAVAMWSRLWDLKDKWVGVVGQVVLVFVGTVLAVALGGNHSKLAGYVHEAQTVSLFLIKIASLLGAGFLAWRVRRGRRSPSVPPWVRDRRP